MTLEQTKKFTEQDENTLQYYNQYHNKKSNYPLKT